MPSGVSKVPKHGSKNLCPFDKQKLTVKSGPSFLQFYVLMPMTNGANGSFVGLERVTDKEQITRDILDEWAALPLFSVPAVQSELTQQDHEKWPSKKSFEFSHWGGMGVVGAASLLLATPSLAEQSQTAPSFEAVKTAIDPLSDLIAGFVFSLSSIWAYLLANPPAAVLLGTLIASVVALFSIHQQRNLTRLRETFSSINNDIWDNDVIKARETLENIRSNISGDVHKISDYCERKSTNIAEVTALQLIMNDYENIALGVKMNILDETYLFRWMRGAVIQDWDTLNPLVSACRAKYKNSKIYIEFEGLATQWQRGRSYRTGRKIKSAVKQFRIT